MSTQQTMRQSLPLLLLVVAILALVVSTAQASGGLFIQPKEIELKPVQHPSQPGPVDLLFRFAPPESYKGDGQFRILAFPKNTAYAGLDEWTITAFPDKPHQEVLSMTIEPDSASGLKLIIYGDNFHFMPVAYFIYRNDSVEFWKGYPLGPQPPADQTPGPDDTLEVRVIMKNQAQLDEVLGVLGRLPDSSLGTRVITTATVRQMYKLMEAGIDIRNLRDWEKDSTKQEPDQKPFLKGTRRTPGRPDTTGGGGDKPQGSLDRTPHDRSAYVCIDTVLPMINDSTVQATDSVEFRFLLDNGLSNRVLGLTNGFKFYSPDGATWDTIWGEWESVGSAGLIRPS